MTRTLIDSRSCPREGHTLTTLYRLCPSLERLGAQALARSKRTARYDENSGKTSMCLYKSGNDGEGGTPILDIADNNAVYKVR